MALRPTAGMLTSSPIKIMPGETGPFDPNVEPPTSEPTPEPEVEEQEEEASEPEQESGIDIWSIYETNGVLTSMPSDWVSPYGPNDNRPRVAQWRSSADFWPEDHEYAGMTTADQVRAMYDLGPNDRITLAQRQRVKRMRRAYDRNFTGLNEYLVQESPTFDEYIENARKCIQTDRGLSIPGCPIKVDFEVGPSWGELTEL